MVVVGAGNSAGQEVLSLAHAEARVTVVVRGERLDRSMSAYLVERVHRHPRVDVLLRSQETELHVDRDRLAAVTVTDAGGASERRAARALFICIGGEPRTSWADRPAFARMKRDTSSPAPTCWTPGEGPTAGSSIAIPSPSRRARPGSSAVGDVRSGSTKRVAAAVGEGAMAVALVHRRLEEVALATC